MSVVEAVQRDIDALGKDAQDSGLAATAIALASELDGANSATSKSMCAKALVDVLRELRALAPPRKENDGVTDIARKREQRLARSSAATDSART